MFQPIGAYSNTQCNNNNQQFTARCGLWVFVQASEFFFHCQFEIINDVSRMPDTLQI